MMKFIKCVSQLMVLASVCVLLVACSRVTQANFDKIKPNMNMSEVVAIIGEPTSTQNITIAGIKTIVSALWQGRNAEISIQFMNGHVFTKFFNLSSDMKVVKHSNKK